MAYPWAAPRFSYREQSSGSGFVTWTPEAAAERMVLVHKEAKRGTKFALCCLDPSSLWFSLPLYKPNLTL